MTHQPLEPTPLPLSFQVSLLDTAAVAVLVADRNRRIAYANTAAALLLGRDKASLPGLDLLDLLPGGDREVLTRLCEAAADGQTLPGIPLVPADGAPDREFLLSLSPVPGESGPWGVAAWLIDNSESRQMAQRLAQAEKIASLGTLAGGVAHHFNNILGGVATFVDFALTSGNTVSMKRALQMTAEAAARASRITQSLLSFAKHDSLQPDLADLTEVVLTFAHLVERPLQERGICLTLEVQPIPILPVEANCMHQVLGHLLTNAEEAMPDGGSVRLSLRPVEGRVELAFSDTGCGIEPAHLPLVFEPFYTTKGLLAGGDRGNPGLGLSIVHGKVLEMGGTIDVRSRPGKGATVLIRFPMPSLLD